MRTISFPKDIETGEMETLSPLHCQFRAKRETPLLSPLSTAVANNAANTANATTSDDGVPNKGWFGSRIADDDGNRYLIQELLGKGGFARVHKLIQLPIEDAPEAEDEPESVFAGKIISKRRINKPDKKDKISREIDIQRKMKHKNVVQFMNFFEDNSHVFIVMEYCGTKTLSNILKARKHLTEPEVRYYLKQLIAGCGYIHSKGVVHRDLKLSNLFINEQMQLKIGDFGLSAYITFVNEKKESICGTPNYISPEVLLKTGHSYPADIWAIGCIIYALLSSRPPFETQCLKDTYKLIAKSKYNEPVYASLHARSLIAKCLRVDPSLRPSLSEMEMDPFLNVGFMPPTLLKSTATEPPNFEKYKTCRKEDKGDVAIDTLQYYVQTMNQQEISAQGGKNLDDIFSATLGCQLVLEALQTTFERIKGWDCLTNPKTVSGDDCLWITKWVDYSHKYGFGFQLSNDIYGASFHDNFSIAVNSDESRVGLHDAVSQITIECPTVDLQKEYERRLQVMKYFVKYMDDTLIKGGDAEEDHKECISLSDVYMLRWLRTKESITMCLSTGTVQVNFFHDHTKFAVSKIPGGDYKVMYVNSKRQASVFNLSDVKKYGLTSEVKLRLQYVMLQLNNMLKSEQEN